jgi:AcrR family transcriptional regulator
MLHPFPALGQELRDRGALRVDARRNRELVLRTASDMFAEEGMAVSLVRVAERAGVGAGTVYRHFPSKEALVEAVLAELVATFTVAADHWAQRAEPDDALIGFLTELIEKSVARKHVCDALAADQSWPRAVLGAEVSRFREAQQRLLARAQRAGSIRADVRADDLAAIVRGGTALRASHRDRARGRRWVRQLLDGLRTRQVTEPGMFRDSGADARHETRGPVPVCGECGARLRVRATGRPPRYCGPTCRQRARRRRAATA